MAALSLALVFTGTCNDDIGSVILQRLMESSDADLTNTASRFMCLGECCGLWLYALLLCALSVGSSPSDALFVTLNKVSTESHPISCMLILSYPLQNNRTGSVVPGQRRARGGSARGRAHHRTRTRQVESHITSFICIRFLSLCVLGLSYSDQPRNSVCRYLKF